MSRKQAARNRRTRNEVSHCREAECGGGYLISWCVGHLVELAEAAAYGEQYKKWSYDSLPILPQPWQYTVFKDRQKQFKILKDLMRRSDISEVVNTCDAGREGELIFRLVYHAAGCDKPFSRLWISSMEKSAIKKGFAELKPGEAYDALYASALCRAKADWIIGINATRLFSVLHGKTLNVGRVQTPTLKMLADRDAAITSFKKETYHIVRLDVGGAEAASARISDAADAEALKTACEASQAVCVSVKRERKTEQPPRLFDLTGLQREANRIYGYTAKQTLDLAQALYEKRLLTYPRTDRACEPLCLRARLYLGAQGAPDAHCAAGRADARQHERLLGALKGWERGRADRLDRVASVPGHGCGRGRGARRVAPRPRGRASGAGNDRVLCEPAGARDAGTGPRVPGAAGSIKRQRGTRPPHRMIRRPV